MAITNHERVGKALELLKAGLAPFVEREFKARFGSALRGQVLHTSQLRQLRGQATSGSSLEC